MHSVDFDVSALTDATFYTKVMSLNMALSGGLQRGQSKRENQDSTPARASGGALFDSKRLSTVVQPRLEQRNQEHEWQPRRVKKLSRTVSHC
jgi:hypothetical protein